MKLYTSVFFVLFLFTNVSFAFYIECLDKNDKSTEIRFFQTEKDGPLSLYALTKIDNTPLIINYKKIINFQIDYYSFTVKKIHYYDPKDIEFNLEISDRVDNSGGDVSAPFPLFSSFKLTAVNCDTIIDSSNLTCRQFNFN